jgi:hypothetical protein
VSFFVADRSYICLKALAELGLELGLIVWECVLTGAKQVPSGPVKAQIGTSQNLKPTF